MTEIWPSSTEVPTIVSQPFVNRIHTRSKTRVPIHLPCQGVELLGLQVVETVIDHVDKTGSRIVNKHTDETVAIRVQRVEPRGEGFQTLFHNTLMVIQDNHL
jgi:hypothetical protein